MRFIKKCAFIFSLFLFSILSDASADQISNKYFIKGHAYLNSEQYQKAIDNYLKGMTYRDNKETLLVWDDIGFAFLKIGEFEKAEPYLLDALDVNPGDFNLHLFLSICYLMRNELDLASQELALCENNIFFNDEWVKKIDGSSCRRINGDELSTRAVERIKKERGILVQRDTHTIEFTPVFVIHVDAFDIRNEAALYFLEAILLKKKTKTEDAEPKFIDALEKGYPEKEIRYQLVDLYIKTKKFSLAEEQYENLKDLISKKEAEILEKYIREVSSTEIQLDSSGEIPAFPHDPQFYVHHRLKELDGRIIQELHDRFFEVLQTGNIVKAVEILEKGWEIKKDLFEFNHNLALLYCDLENYEKAEYFGARALWFKEDHVKAHDLMGNIYFQQGEFQKAYLEYSQMTSLDERNASACYNLGVTSISLQKPKEAEAFLLKAIELDSNKESDKKRDENESTTMSSSIYVHVKPTSLLSYLALGELYFDQGRIGESKAMYEEAKKQNPRSAEAHLGLAKIYINENQYEMAESLIKEYLYLGGNKEEADILYKIIKK
jgi:tetratricopeptide (TPR) repeat protein